MKPNFLPFIGEKWAGVPEPKARFEGKIIIITGANVGLGFEAALKFVALGASKVILAVRDVLKGAAAARQIEDRTQRKGVAEVWKLDMDHYSSVSQFAARASSELPRLDIAILNAGATYKDYTVGPEGWESTLQVNVMSTALLALLLLPKLRASKSSVEKVSHLVIVTSEAHRWVEATDIPIGGPKNDSILLSVNTPPADIKTWNGLNQNAKSKLLAMYVMRSIAALETRSNREIDVIVSATCPGACRSDLTRNFKGAGLSTTVGLKIFNLLFSKTTEEGARVYVSAAALGPEAHGCWYKTTALTK
jgi:NAD(P)-dependent dehydrogenase (short-subunit alcohol dehydrogenase family)